MGSCVFWVVMVMIVVGGGGAMCGVIKVFALCCARG